MVQRSFAVRASMRARLLGALLLLGLADTALATGFFINQQGVKGLGRVGAGNAAIADELATIYFNPAGLVESKWDAASPSRFEFGFHLIVPRSDLRNTGSTAATPGTLGAPTAYGGGNARNPTDPAPVPSFFWARQLVPGRAAIGAGFTLPFGLASEFPADGFGRYDAIEASLRTANLTAVAAWRFDSGVSIGGGVDLQYANSLLVTAVPDPLNPGGPTAATDARVRTRGHDWTPGFNIGILFPAGESTRVGLHYRSGMRHELEGTTTISGLSGPLAPFNRSVGAKAVLHLPAIAAVALRHHWTDDLQLLASVEWYDWSRFREVRVRFADGSPDAVRAANYRDAFALAIGAEYRVSDHLWTRGGIRVDQTPTRDGFRDTTVPDARRIWLGVGATWRSSAASSWDFAFNHVFFRRADVDVTRTFFEGTPLASSVRVSGRAKSVVNTVAVAYRRAF